MTPQRAFLGLGSNVGDRQANLKAAAGELQRAAGVEVVAIASIYETEPIGEVTEQADFLNTAIEVETQLEPLDLLDLLKRVEGSVGRTPTIKHGPREIDIDLLIYDAIEGSFGVRDDGRAALILPHPLNLERAFVLAPLLELDPTLQHPDGTRLSDALAGLGHEQRLALIATPEQWWPHPEPSGLQG